MPGLITLGRRISAAKGKHLRGFKGSGVAAFPVGLREGKNSLMAAEKLIAWTL